MNVTSRNLIKADSSSFLRMPSQGSKKSSFVAPSTSFNLDAPLTPNMSMREELQTTISYFTKFKPHEIVIPFQGTSLQVSVDRGKFFFGTREGKLVAAQMDTKEITHEVDLKEGPIRTIALYQNDAYLFSGGQGGVIKRFDMTDMREIGTFRGHTGEVEDLFVSKDESTLYSLGKNGVVFKWDIQVDYPNPVELYHHDGEGCGMDLGSDNKFLASCGTDFMVIVFNLNSGKIEKKILNPKGSIVRCVKITETNKFLGFGDDSWLVHLYRFGTWEFLYSFMGHTDKVKAIEASFDEKYLISGGSEGKIFFWSTENLHEGLELEGHNDGVKALILIKDIPYLYSMSDDNKIMTWKIPIFNHAIHHPVQTDLKLRDILPCPGDNDSYFFVYKFEVIRYNREKRESRNIFRFGQSRIVCYGVKTDEKVSKFRHKKKLQIGRYSIAVYELDTERMLKELEIESYGIYTCIFSNDDKFILIGELNHCTVINFETEEEHYVYKGHKSEVSCILQSNDSKFLFTGDKGGIIKSFEFETKTEIRVLKDETASTKEDNSTIGMCSTKNSEFMISHYANSKLFVWDCFKMAKDNSIKLENIKEICITGNKDLIYCLLSSQIKVINVPTLINCFQIDLTGSAQYFCFSSNESEIGVYMDGKVGFYKVPGNGNTIEVCGDYTKIFQFYHTMGKLVSGRIRDHRPVLNNWIIEPFHINITHIHAYLDHHKLIPTLFNEKVGYFPSSSGYSPLEISLKMDFEKTTTTFFNEFKKQTKTNPLFFLNLENDLVQINKSPFLSVHKFYKFAILKSIDSKLPRFCTNKDKLPVVIHSPTLLAHRTSFMKYEEFSNDGVELNFKQTYFRVNMIPGSSESLELLSSIIESENDLLLATDFISLLLSEKWKIIRPILYLQTLIYVGYLVFLSLYAIYGGENILFAFAFNVVLGFYEMIQGIFGGMPYFQDPWNYIDIVRAILKTALFVDYLGSFTKGDHNILLAAVLFVSFIRGLSYFRIVSGPRYYVNLIYEVIFDIVPFLIILFYTTASFSLIFRVLMEKDDTQLFYLTASWEINVGGFDTSNYSSIMYLAFFLHTVINPLIMLNLLISILGDTFDRVSEKTVVADCKELAGMVLECELFFFFNKSKKNKSYLHICEGLKDSYKTDDSMLRKIKDKMKTLKTMQKTVISELNEIKKNQVKSEDLKIIMEKQDQTFEEIKKIITLKK